MGTQRGPKSPKRSPRGPGDPKGDPFGNSAKEEEGGRPKGGQGSGGRLAGEISQLGTGNSTETFSSRLPGCEGTYIHWT